MTTNVEICNVALIRLERAIITSLTDGSPSGNACNVIFAPTREKLLREHAWNFARKKQKLSRSVTAPISGFDFAYPLPADWLATRRVHDNDADTGVLRYKMAGSSIGTEDIGRHIETDADNVYLTFTYAVTDPALFDALFAEMFSADIGTQLGRTSTIRDEQRKLLKSAKNMARSSDAIEDGPTRRPRGSWNNARFRSGHDNWPGHH